ncbi:FERM and PDZ domain-containing protein 2 [Paramisgurnus dabryanus]|uniref:FERM and PDZ domain-containing protein 2 n=1 Tax=Paramisgurnus dabryanus TaxID=90735 RepID=UPI0031F43518
MSIFVTLAEVLESRGASLEEDEVWALLQVSAKALIDISSKNPGNMCCIISPCSTLLSTSGRIAFKTCSRSEDLASFTSPEISQNNAYLKMQATEKMVIYSLGMTLYWTVDYLLPQTQPVQLSDHLNSLLLSMCEDLPHKRVNLLTVLEMCEEHHKSALLFRPENIIKRMAEDVLQLDVSSVHAAHLTDQRQMVRERLRGTSCQKYVWPFKGSRTSPQANIRSCHNSHQRSKNSIWLTHNPYLRRRLNETKIKDLGPEFIRMLEEPLVILELPNSLVSNKGRFISNQRDLRVLMPNGLNILVRCDVKSRAGDIFDMIIAHSNLVEHFYFGLAYSDGDEFLFINNETNISKVAPDSWKKVPTATFTLYFRIKFFVNDISLLLHKLTRHQYYLQLRRDLLEDRLPCNKETCLFLGALALQAECGDSLPEVYGKKYFQPEHYVSKSVLQKMAMPCLKEKLLQLHAKNADMAIEESELEFLKTIQQLPEYGVLFHRVACEKKHVNGELLLGVCAKGVIVYEVINNSLTASLRFHWREITSITSARCKFVIESGTCKKKLTFLTERSKVAKYLCDLCSAQHKFHKEMSSRLLTHRLASEENIVQYAAMCRAQNNTIRRMSEVKLKESRINATTGDSMSKLCEDTAIRIQAKIKEQRRLLNHTGINSPSYCSSQKLCSEVPSMCSLLKDTPTCSRSTEREIVYASLKKDPKIGLGIVIVGEDGAGRLDFGIFIASIVPGGPADQDGRIKPGGRLISLNQISLEGVSFTEAADIIQNSSNEVELIVSQPQALNNNNGVSGCLTERNYESQSTILVDSRAGDDCLDELVSVMMTPKSINRLHVPEVRIINAQDDYSRSGSLTCLRPEEFFLKLRKARGSLGISITGGVNTHYYGSIYIKSLVPGGVAEQDGRIQPGDRLLEVDGTRLQGFTDQQAVECLARTGEVVNLVLERNRDSEVPLGPMLQNRLTVNTPASVTTQMKNTCPAFTMTTPFTIKPKDYSFVSDDNIFKVTLKKRLNGLGFSLFISELNTSLDCGTIVRIRTLFPGQAAEESGKIQQGDVILSINGEPLKGLSYQQVLQLLKNSPSDVELVLCRPAKGTLPLISEKIGQLTCS